MQVEAATLSSRSPDLEAPASTSSTYDAGASARAVESGHVQVEAATLSSSSPDLEAPASSSSTYDACDGEARGLDSFIDVLGLRLLEQHEARGRQPKFIRHFHEEELVQETWDPEEKWHALQKSPVFTRTCASSPTGAEARRLTLARLAGGLLATWARSQRPKKSCRMPLGRGGVRESRSQK